MLTIFSASSSIVNHVCLPFPYSEPWLVISAPLSQRKAMLLHPLLYRAGHSACQAVAVYRENNMQALFLHLWYVLLGNPPTNSRGCWVALAHTVAIEINRHIAISFLVFSLRHFPTDDNYRVKLFTAISMLVSFCVSFIRVWYISLTNSLATCTDTQLIGQSMLCSPLAFNSGLCHLSTAKRELWWTSLWSSRVLFRDLAALAPLPISTEGLGDLCQVVLFSILDSFLPSLPIRDCTIFPKICSWYISVYKESYISCT